MKKKRKRKAKMDIRKHRFVPNMNTSTKIIVDKKRKSRSRRVLNDKRNWD